MTAPAAPDPGFRRFSSVPLPAYRYVPGCGLPHPVKDPRGHSHSRVEPDFAAESATLAENWRGADCFCYGVDLYNFAFWWEAHENWEGLWRCYEIGDPRRHGLQGLIQISAAHLKRHIGHARGVQTLLARAGRNFELACPAGGRMFGVELRDWWSAWVSPYLAGSSAAEFPFLAPA